MPVADLNLPGRLLAGGGPGCPDGRVLRALASPVVGQFDPAFTAIMDEVTLLARQTFLTRNARCFPVSGLAAAGLEALLNTLVEPGDRVAICGDAGFVAETTDMARRYGAVVQPLDSVEPGTSLVVAPAIDRQSGRRTAVQDIAAECCARGVPLIVEASQALAGVELRVDEWGIAACVAGVEYAVGAPAGMALVTYTPALEARMHARCSPPRTSYLDLLQLGAYWSAERSNHHTAPTGLVYGLREALRLVHEEEGLPESWARHQRVGEALHAGLRELGLDVGGDPPYAIVPWPTGHDEAGARRALLDQFGVYVRLVAPRTWCVALLGADARLDAVMRVVTAIERVLDGRPRAVGA